jgi:hypothetical protein
LTRSRREQVQYHGLFVHVDFERDSLPTLPRNLYEVESGRHTRLTPRGLPEALPKPDKHLSAHPAIPRPHPYGCEQMSAGTLRRPSATRACLPSERSAEALRPAAALPAALVGRDSHGYYGLSALVPALGIRHPTILELEPVPALLVSQVLCSLRCPLDPFAWRTRFGTSLLGCKAREAPALSEVWNSGCGARAHLLYLPWLRSPPPKPSSQGGT